MIDFILPSETEMLKPEVLMQFIRLHREEVVNRYNVLFNLYDNNAPILFDAPKAPHKPDNRLAVNFAKYIVETLNGYFIGVPVKTTHDDERVASYIEKVQQYNDQDDNNSELCKLASIFGRAYELLFIDELAQVGITYIDPREAFIIYDDSIRRRKKYGVRYFLNEKGDYEGSFSDDRSITYFKQTPKGIVYQEVVPHYFKDVPMIECIENEERRGSFESVYTLSNAYNNAISEKTNDVDYFADAYMKILGAELDEIGLAKIKDNRIINIEGEGTESLIVEFMEKPNGDQTQENLINRLEKLIFQIAMVANINDESFGNASGVSLKYKLHSMSNLANTKERKFTSLMNQRWKMIANLPNAPITDEDWLNIGYTFTRNIPANTLDESEVARNLQGIVSDETLLSTLSVVSNVKAEIDRKQKEVEERSLMYPGLGVLDELGEDTETAI